VSRELGRNTCPEVGYTSETAMALHGARRTAAKPAAKLDVGGVTWGVVLTLLSWKWSPQQIAATLKRVYPDQPEHHVSHETIYTAIYAQPRGELRRQLIACLRQGRSTRMPRSRGTDRRGQIPEMVSIHVRPPEVNDRVMPGHWEGDLCVQRRLACSAGDSPAGVEVRSPVAWIAERSESDDLKPIDKPSEREGASHRAVTKVNADVASTIHPRRPSPQVTGEGSMGSRNLTDTADRLRRGRSDSTVTQDMPSNWRSPPRPSAKSPEQGRPYNR
jgi:hypothetical protein